MSSKVTNSNNSHTSIASGEVSPKELEPVAEALEIRTDSEEFLCDAGCINGENVCETECNYCKYHSVLIKKKLKEL